MPPIRRQAPGDAPRQRPPDQPVTPLAKMQHDDPYHSFQAGHVNAEMIRPNVGNFEDEGWGGYDVGLMRIAGLARSIQTKLYMHNCTPKYCLQNRTLALQIHPRMYECTNVRMYEFTGNHFFPAMLRKYVSLFLPLASPTASMLLRNHREGVSATTFA